MKYLFILLAIFVRNISFAQNIKDTVEYYVNTEKAQCQGYDVAHYYRLAYKEGDWWRVKDFYIDGVKQMDGLYSEYVNGNFKREQGMFLYYHPNGKIEKKVRYIKGLKEGLVKCFDSSGKLIDSGYYSRGMPYKTRYKWDEEGNVIFKGVYEELATGAGEEWEYYSDGKILGHGKLTDGNVKDSVWVYYYPNGVISTLETYKNDSLLDISCYDEIGKIVTNECTPIKLPEPTFNMRTYLATNFQYPTDARENNVQGRVSIQFVVNEDGSISDVKAIGHNRLGYGCEQEAIRVISKMPKWKPGKQHNRVVKVYFTQPITFKLEN